LASPIGRDEAGRTYVIYGKTGGYPSPIDLAYPLPSSDGSVIYGAFPGDRSGFSVSCCEFNNDGITDLVIGAPDAIPLGRDRAGSIYVVYGKKGGYSSNIDLNTFP
jgi:hypothetical protein